MAAVKQDTFDDIDEEAREMIASGEKLKERETEPVPAPSTPTIASSLPRSSDDDVRGVAAPLLNRVFPRLLDPQGKTLVWGAPPVDRVGRLGDRSK